MFRAARAAVLVACLAVPARAEVTDDVDALLSAVGMPDLIEIMREEGIDYGATLEEELFPGRGGDSWQAIIRQTYDGERMLEEFSDRFAAELAGDNVQTMLDFFTSERGQRIVSFEISARRALLEDGIEEAAIETWEEAREEGSDRLSQIERFVEANDLVESNVMGAMNANYAFYTGLLDGNAFPRQLTEDQVLSDVWGQEDAIREDTAEWVFSYLMLAYQPLSDEDLEVYTALSETEEGRALNRALFAAFDDVFTDISRTLGLAAARYISGQDI